MLLVPFVIFMSKLNRTCYTGLAYPKKVKAVLNMNIGPTIQSIINAMSAYPMRYFHILAIFSPNGFSKYNLPKDLALYKSACIYANLIHWKLSRAVLVTVQSMKTLNSNKKGTFMKMLKIARLTVP